MATSLSTKKPYSSFLNSEESTLELADVFAQFGKEYRNSHTLSPNQYKVMYDIENCRTEEFGHHWDICDNCSYMERAYNSCRNRHCPKCNGTAQRRWVQARIEDLLPVSYHHAVFTLPHIFNPLTFHNERFFYNLLFDCASETLLQFGNDPRHLGAQIGFYGILHTWGGMLWRHLHIHFIVTAGGITTSGNWVSPKYHGKFLFPIKAMSFVYRAKVIERLKKAHAGGELVFPENLEHLRDNHSFDQWLFHQVPKKWVVFSKPPFNGPENVVRYMGRYTHRVAISNNRIVSIQGNEIVFLYKNTRKNSAWERGSLSAMNFIGRFLMHVLPNGFHRIRHYGFLANGKAKENIRNIREFLKVKTNTESARVKDTGLKIPCPICKIGKMVTVLIINWWGKTVQEAGLRILLKRPITIAETG